jgi:hypothetical protein
VPYVPARRRPDLLVPFLVNDPSRQAGLLSRNFTLLLILRLYTMKQALCRQRVSIILLCGYAGIAYRRVQLISVQ